jgi:cell division transport system permease protein
MKLLTRAFRIAFSNIKSSIDVCAVSVITIMVAFAILELFLLVFANLNSLVETWNKQVQLIVYLDDSVSKKDQSSLENLIANNRNIQGTSFVTKGQAWIDFKKTFSDKAAILESLGFNPLPASLRLQFSYSSERLEAIQKFAKTLEVQKGVESVEYGKSWILKFETFLAFLRLFLLAVGGLLIMGLILIISNTIKLSIYSRKEEIQLMALLGARPNFIKWPFLMEGMLQALVGALLSLGVIKIVYLYMKVQFQDSMGSLFRGIYIQFIPDSFAILILLGSLFSGWLGSYISINRFLKSELK